MTNRKKISDDIQSDVLITSARRCLLCYHLHGDINIKKGQIAHLDKNPENSNFDNLAFLCLEHHSEYDSRTSQHKNFTLAEVKKLRDYLLLAIKTNEHHAFKVRTADKNTAAGLIIASAVFCLLLLLVLLPILYVMYSIIIKLIGTSNSQRLNAPNSSSVFAIPLVLAKYSKLLSARSHA